MLDYLNAFGSATLFCVCTWIIFSKRVHEGPIIRLGLSLIAIAHFVSILMFLDDVPDSNRQIASIHLMIFVGVLLCLVGYWWRTRDGHYRRMSDWIDTETGAAR